MLGLLGYQNSYNATSFLAGMLRMLSIYHTCNDLEESRQHIITTVTDKGKHGTKSGQNWPFRHLCAM